LESGPAFCVRCIGDRALDYVDEIEREFFPAQALEWRLTLVALLLAIAGGVISRHFLASREGPSSAVRGLPSTIARFLRSFSVGEIYAAGIVGLAVLLPYYALRYLIPAMPFLFAYALSGALWFGWFGRKWTHGKPVGALLLILGLLGAYGLKHRIFAYNMVTYAPLVGIEARESQDIFAYVRNRIPEGALVAFEKPRVLALFTGKRSTIWDPVPEGPPDLAATILLNDFLEREVGYLLVSSGGGVPIRPRWFQEGPVQDAFELQHATRHFQVWRFDQESARRVLQAISEGVPASPTPGSAPL
jgi:hypothetical protein